MWRFSKLTPAMPRIPTLTLNCKMGKHKQPGMSILAVQNDILPITYWKKLEILENAGVVCL